MKSMLFVLLALGVTGTPTLAAQTLNKDESLACSVVLCLANPAGPTALSQCNEPIREWAKRQAKGKTMPKCPGVNSGDGDGNGGGGGSRDDGDGRVRLQQH